MSCKKYRYCIVPKCPNTTFTAPEKIYFDVPRHKVERTQWCKAMKRDIDRNRTLSYKSVRNVCEDHFDLELDTENYVKHKLQGVKLKLKKGILPHIFACQEEKPSVPSIERTDRAAERLRKKIVEDALKNYDVFPTPIIYKSKADLHEIVYEPSMLEVQLYIL